MAKQILPAGWVEQTMTPGELSSQYASHVVA